jgi:hypothetical protein
MRISGTSSDPSQVHVLDEDLTSHAIELFCKIIIVKEVLQSDVPLQHIKTFTEFCRYCIFPFLHFS